LFLKFINSSPIELHLRRRSNNNWTPTLKGWNNDNNDDDDNINVRRFSKPVNECHVVWIFLILKRKIFLVGRYTKYSPHITNNNSGGGVGLNNRLIFQLATDYEFSRFERGRNSLLNELMNEKCWIVIPSNSYIL
jgi:hypothetical protein